MKPVQNRETLPSSLNVFCWLWLLDQEGGSGPTGLKYSRKLNRLDDIVLFTVADRESFLLVCLSLLFPFFFFLSALLSELPHLLLRTQIICIWRDSWLVCCGWNFIFWKAVTLAVTSLDAWVSGLWANSWCYILWLKNPKTIHLSRRKPEVKVWIPWAPFFHLSPLLSVCPSHCFLFPKV